MKSFSLLAPKALGCGSTVRSPRRSALKSLQRLLRRWPTQRASLLAASHVRPASTSPIRPARPTSLKADLATPFLFLSSRLPEVSNNPWSVTESPNIDRGDTHIDNRRKKLEQLSVQQIQNARLMHTSLLSYVRRAKSAFGNQNMKLKRLAFLRLHLSNATFNNARSVSLLRGMRPTSL